MKVGTGGCGLGTALGARGRGQGAGAPAQNHVQRAVSSTRAPRSRQGDPRLEPASEHAPSAPISSKQV